MDCDFGSCLLRLVIVYRPPYSNNHRITCTTSLFFDELNTYLESIVLSPEPLLITGDLNIHMDEAEGRDTLHLLDILESMGLERNLANCKKEDLTLHVPDHDSSNFKLIANVINNYFAGFSQAQVPLNFDTLPAYLPSPSPAPRGSTMDCL